jgi:serine/threonine-protein kinase
MGTVLLAHHEGLDQDVAIKVLSSDAATNHEFIVRLQREAKAVAKLKSEHAVRVTDVDTLEDAGPYMVMEYLEGQSLKQEVDKRGPLPVGEVVSYMLQALDALAEAHALGIVHRDLKPSNLFLHERPDGTRSVKVLDFGISKIELLCEPTDDLTASRALLGTPLYMSPEQLKSPSDVDARADIWSLGVVMYELLTGEAPFAGNTVGELCFAIVETTPKPLAEFRADVPPALDRIIQRCLRRNPGQRFASAEELVLALLPFAHEHADVPRPRVRRPSRRAVIAASILLAAIAAVFVWQAQPSTVAAEAPIPSLSPATQEHARLESSELPAPAPTSEPTAVSAMPQPPAPKGGRPPSITAKPQQKRSKPSPNATPPAADPNLDIRH